MLSALLIGLVVADIDNFKQINDRFGHPVGDEVLTQVAQVFARSLRELDLAARYGGEEFVVVLPGARLAAARRTAERLRRAIEELDVTTPRGPVGQVSASFGVAEFPTYTSPAELFEAADNALYEAKGAGKNRVASATRAKRARVIGTAAAPTAGA